MKRWEHIHERLLKAGKKFAEEHQTSLNALIRKLLEQNVETASTDWIDESFDKMDRLKVNSEGRKWNRGELYDI